MTTPKTLPSNSEERLLTNASTPTIPTTRVPRRPYGDALPAHSSARHRLPGTLPIVGLGCSSFSHFFSATSDHESDDDLSWVTPDHPLVRGWVDTVVRAVADRGIDYLDTAPWYGHGVSELVVGFAVEALRTRRGVDRSRITLATKVGRYASDPEHQFDFSARRVERSVRESVRRMRCGYLDVVQLHDPEFAPSEDLLVEETIPALVRLRDDGEMVRAIGVTGYPLSVQRRLIARCPPGTFDQSLTYCRHNLHDASLFEEGFAEFLRERGTGLLCAAPLSMGLLTPAGPPDWHPAGDALRAACREAARLTRGDVARLALLHALRDARVPCTLIGASDVTEVDAAADVAAAFARAAPDARYDDPPGTLADRGVATPVEAATLALLLDRGRGPFAATYRDGRNRWDGEAEATAFWERVPGGRERAEWRMREATDETTAGET